MDYDIQVVAQGILYFFIALMGLITAFPLGITLINFGGNCCLFTSFTWVNATYADVSLGDGMLCEFPVYTAVFGCVLYALGVGVYHMYAALRSRDPRIGFQMWIMPFILANTLVTVLMFVTCCIVSLGIRSTCDSILDGKEKGNAINSCPNATSYNWNLRRGKSRTDYNFSHFYDYTKATEAAGWIVVLSWFAQEGLCVLRIIRNIRNRSDDLLSAYNEASEDGKAAGAQQEMDSANYI